MLLLDYQNVLIESLLRDRFAPEYVMLASILSLPMLTGIFQRSTHIHRPSRLRLRQRHLPHLDPQCQNPNTRLPRYQMLPGARQIRRTAGPRAGVWRIHRGARERLRLQRADRSERAVHKESGIER